MHEEVPFPYINISPKQNLSPPSIQIEITSISDPNLLKSITYKFIKVLKKEIKKL